MRNLIINACRHMEDPTLITVDNADYQANPNDTVVTSSSPKNSIS